MERRIALKVVDSLRCVVNPYPTGKATAMSSVLRTVLAATSLGAAAAFGLAGSAMAAPVVPDGMSRPDSPDGSAALGASELTGAVAAYDAVSGVVDRTQLNPMNGGGVNPLSNTVGAGMGDQQVGTGMVTGDIADGVTVREFLDKF